MTTDSQSTEKSISEADFPQLWRELTHNQQRFAVAMLDSTSKKDAALMIGIEPDTVYRWNGALDDVIAFMRTQARDAALEILAHNVVKAAMVKAAGLDSTDEKARQDAAAEVLDRVLGKPTSRTEVSGPDRGPIEYRGFDKALERAYGNDTAADEVS